MARYTSSAPTSAQADVNSLVASNTFGAHTPSVVSCEYIGGSGGFDIVGTCNQTVPWRGRDQSENEINGGDVLHQGGAGGSEDGHGPGLRESPRPDGVGQCAGVTVHHLRIWGVGRRRIQIRMAAPALTF